MKRTLIGVALIVQLAGCTAMHTAIEKQSLDVQTRMTDAIFLEPIDPADGKPYVYVRVRNTTGNAAFEITEDLKQALEARGFWVTQSPKKAFYTLDAHVLHIEKTTPQKFAGMNDGTFGDMTAGAMTGAVIGSAARRHAGPAIGAGVGALAFGLGATIADAMTQDVLYFVVTDVQVGEHAEGVSEQKSTESQSGMGHVRAQYRAGKSHRLYHRTRIVSRANKVNLEIEEAAEQLKLELVSSLAGIL